MIKVQTFTNELKILHVMQELREIDDQVNNFIKDNDVKNVISVSDTSTTGDAGTIGIIRVLTYETA
ncbi:hypothetical protein ACFL47_04675 [Candidatus Latescibacterota bacterium]